MKTDPNIDELLTGYIDGQLGQRQQIEVKRLIAHDPQIAERLEELEKCRLLVGSLPSDEAPEDLVEQVTASLERRTLLGIHEDAFDQRRGERHLMFRKVLTAAAMVILIMGLALVIYNIVAPVPMPKKPVAIKMTRAPAVKVASKELEKPATEITKKAAPVEPVLAAQQFDGRLELKTKKPLIVSVMINQAIEENGLVDIKYPTDITANAITCNSAKLNSLLNDLQGIWERVESATLIVQTEKPAGKVIVDFVNTNQIAEIINQNDYETRIKAAKYYAVVNNMTNIMPSKEILADADTDRPELMDVPKPALTSSPKTAADQTKADQKLNLTIIVIPVSAAE